MLDFNTDLAECYNLLSKYGDFTKQILIMWWHWVIVFAQKALVHVLTRVFSLFSGCKILPKKTIGHDILSCMPKFNYWKNLFNIMTSWMNFCVQIAIICVLIYFLYVKGYPQLPMWHAILVNLETLVAYNLVTSCCE